MSIWDYEKKHESEGPHGGEHRFPTHLGEVVAQDIHFSAPLRNGSTYIKGDVYQKNGCYYFRFKYNITGDNEGTAELPINGWAPSRSKLEHKVKRWAYTMLSEPTEIYQRPPNPRSKKKHRRTKGGTPMNRAAPPSTPS